MDDITLVVVDYKSEDYNSSLDYPEHISKELITEWDWK
jgi:hypothetical protein